MVNRHLTQLIPCIYTEKKQMSSYLVNHVHVIKYLKEWSDHNVIISYNVEVYNYYYQEIRLEANHTKKIEPRVRLDSDF